MARSLRGFKEKPTKHDWQEDWEHENGEYVRKCFQCGVGFIGHKRRSICKVCHEKNKLTKDDVFGVRVQLGLSQAELADLTGVNTMTVSRWERDILEVSGQHAGLLRALLAAYEKDLGIGEKLIPYYTEHGFSQTVHFYVKVAYGESVAKLIVGIHQ